MKNKVQHFIDEKLLFTREDKLILGISGGADSVCLMHILLALNYSFELAHCNFNLRAEESDADEVFVKELAKKYQLEIHIKQFDTLEYASKNKISTQMAARDLRYAWFDDLLNKTNSKYIAIAHHENDDVETFFINLVRGSGLTGLLGIKEKNNAVVRPLLSVSRLDIEQYLNEKGLLFREDSSNASLKYLRNKIRHELMPLLTEMNPSIQDTIKGEIKILEGVSQIYTTKTEEIRKELMQEKNGIVKFKISDLLALNSLQNYLYELLNPYGFVTIDAIAKTLQGQSGKQFFSATHQLVVDREYILISPVKIENEVFVIAEKTVDLLIPLSLKFKITADKNIVLDSAIAKLDFEKLKFPLTLRKWQEGDKFMPLGMKKFKKLSDFFIDIKFSILDKQEQWLLCSGDDIVWVVGCRIDERYKLETDTKKVYIAQL
jgi:tRNA(Ile)-lysidine synthase|tara:strand:+ start:1178 stop:2479 length:1302 start_codon:yes stop_codon:yes gene_type:complete